VALALMLCLGVAPPASAELTARGQASGGARAGALRAPATVWVEPAVTTVDGSLSRVGWVVPVDRSGVRPGGYVVQRRGAGENAWADLDTPVECGDDGRCGAVDSTGGGDGAVSYRYRVVSRLGNRWRSPNPSPDRASTSLPPHGASVAGGEHRPGPVVLGRPARAGQGRDPGDLVDLLRARDGRTVPVLPGARGAREITSPCRRAPGLALTVRVPAPSSPTVRSTLSVDVFLAGDHPEVAIRASSHAGEWIAPGAVRHAGPATGAQVVSAEFDSLRWDMTTERVVGICVTGVRARGAAAVDAVIARMGEIPVGSP
jgi:hypothetical protein